MNIHKNARLTPLRREEMALAVIEGGFSKAHAARRYGVSAEDRGALGRTLQGRGQHRHGRPLVPTQNHAGHDRRGGGRAHRGATAPALDRQAHRHGGRRLARHREPGAEARRPVTAERHRACRAGPALRAPASRRDAPYRHQEARPLQPVGHRITGDPQKGRSYGVGWEFVHVSIDDASRIAFSQILPDERQESAVAFLKAAVAYYASLGVTVTRVMTDNGSCYRSKAFAKACRNLGLKHVRTRPYTPRTNGKAERFIQTALREWAYAIAYPTSHHRAAELPIWLHRYNWHRPHGSLKSKPPISRLGLTEDNLLRLHS